MLLFELETCQLSDEVLKRPIGPVIRSLRALCYVIIVYAFTGYLDKALGFGLYLPAAIPDACSWATKQFALLVELDEYQTLTAHNCAGITGALFVNEQARTLAEAGPLVQATRLAWADVVNSGAWLLILALLEFDVQPGVKGLFPGWVAVASRRTKGPALRRRCGHHGVLGNLRHLSRFLGCLLVDRRLRLHRTQTCAGRTREPLIYCTIGRMAAWCPRSTLDSPLDRSRVSLRDALPCIPLPQ